MDHKKSAQTAWTVAAVLAVLLIIALGFWWNAKHDLAKVLESGKQDITAQRDKIRADCALTDAASKAQCGQDLQDLADILREFSTNVAHATTTTTGSGSFQVNN